MRSAPWKAPGAVAEEGGRPKLDDRRPGFAVFLGVFDPKDPPGPCRNDSSGCCLRKGVLPEGDFRDWSAIEAWAREIGQALAPARSPVASV